MNTTPLQVRNAYRAGWNASAKIEGPSLDSAEDTYLRRGRTDAQHDAWLAGWVDYAADNDYGTALQETPAPAMVHIRRTDEVNITECGLLTDYDVEITDAPISVLSGKGVAVFPDVETPAGPQCQACWHAFTTPAAAPITVDSTPAGIFAAMMRANASESAAPQDRLYGLLSDYLRRTLVRTYGIDADAVYHAIMSSGECSDDVISDTLADAAYLRGARGGRNYFVTASSAIAYELRHVMQISRDWRQGMTDFATIGQHGSGYWTVTQGHTASGAPMELTDEPMILTCVTRFSDERQASAAVRANGYR